MVHELCSFFGVVVNIEVVKEDRYQSKATETMEVTMKSSNQAVLVADSLNGVQVFNKTLKAKHLNETWSRFSQTACNWSR